MPIQLIHMKEDEITNCKTFSLFAGKKQVVCAQQSLKFAVQTRVVLKYPVSVQTHLQQEKENVSSKVLTFPTNIIIHETKPKYRMTNRWVQN